MARTCIAILLVAAACSPSSSEPLSLAVDPFTDHAPQFVGSWTGPMTFTNREEPALQTAVPVSIFVARTAFDEVHLSGLCGDGNGSATSSIGADSHRLSLPDVSCSPQAVPYRGCSPRAVALHFDDATVGPTGLSLRGTASTACGYAASFSLEAGKAAPGVPLLAVAVQEPSPWGIAAALHLHATAVACAASSYRWQLSAPDGSAATLATDGADAVLIADLPGLFTVSVAGVSGATAGPAVTTAVTVTQTGPKLTTLVPAAAVIGEATALDATGTLATSWAWEMRARPPASGASLSSADAAIARFTPDVAGDYVFYLAAADAAGTSAAMFTITAYPPLPTLPFHPAGAAWSRSLGRIVASAGSDLHLFDPSTSADETVALSGAGGTVAVSPDQAAAAVRGAQDVWSVDLGSRSVVHWPTYYPDTIASDLAVSDPLPDGSSGTARFAYLMPSIIEVRNLSTGAQPSTNRVAGEGAVVPGAAAFLNFNQASNALELYPIVNGGMGLNPQVFPVSSGGHGWFSADGASLLLASRTIVRTSDYAPVGTAAGSAVVRAVEAGGRWFFIDEQGAVYVQDAGGARRIDLPRLVVGGTAYDLVPKYVFFDADASHRIILAEVPTPETWALLVAPND